VSCWKTLTPKPFFGRWRSVVGRVGAAKTGVV
jgi:hypothetical protein